MSILDPLTATRRPRPGTPVLAADEVRSRLLALNRPSAPFRIVEGGAEGADLTAEWKIVESEWQAWFARAGIRRIFRILLRFDPVQHVVRTIDHSYDVTWEGEVATLRLAVSGFRGQSQSIEFGQTFAYTEQRESGEVIRYRLDTREMKKPIGEAVTSCGWTLKGVAFARL
jgi:hypothetical protein